ncbi:MAG: oxidoreductase [Bacteroidetes bacterium]|nr:oxidoreductase [Bacteroidota bacterium]
MKFYSPLFFLLLFFSCSNEISAPATFTGVKVQKISMDSLSMRAIELMQGNVVFAANKGTFGMLSLPDLQVKQNRLKGTLESNLEFRSVAHTPEDFFMLSVENPAMLYKTGDQGQMELVYTENETGVFYDAMTFFDAQKGIAVGDAVGGCLSVIRTTDGGKTWRKTPCDQLPASEEGEGAFAASNTNIKTMGSKAWMATTAANIYYSQDYGQQWDVFPTPVKNDSIEAYGIYSIDFWNAKEGIAYGGSFLSPKDASANLAITKDGGKTWKLQAVNENPGYKSCVRYVPGTKGQGVVAIGFTGISYSNDGGLHWETLSDASFYTLRFANSTTAYAAGKGAMAKLVFY